MNTLPVDDPHPGFNHNEAEAYILKWVKAQSTEFSLFLDGPWGSGKTHFIKNQIIKHSALKDHRVIYFSLFGINSVEDLERTKFELSSSGLEKSLLFSVNVVTNVAKLENWIDLKGLCAKVLRWFRRKQPAILILDDIERCSMRLDVLTGYINQLVEHSDTKVLLVGSYDEMRRQAADCQTKLRHLQQLDDKVIGQKIRLATDVSIAFDSQIKKLRDDWPRQSLQSRKPLIGELFNRSKCNNFRALARFMNDWQVIADKIDPEFRKNKEFIDEFIYHIWIFVVEIGQRATEEGQQEPNLGANLVGNKNIPTCLYLGKYGANAGEQNDSTQKPVIEQILQKYCEYHSLLTYRPVKDILSINTYLEFLTNGTISREKLNEELENAPLLGRLGQGPNWRYIWHHYGLDLDDAGLDEFDQKLAEFVNQMSSADAWRGKPEEFRHTARLYLKKILDGTVEEDFNHALARMKAMSRDVALDTAPELAERLQCGPNWNKFQLGYSGSAEPWATEFDASLMQALKARADNWYIGQAPKVLTGLFSKSIEAFTTALYNSGGERHYRNRPVLQRLAPSVIFAEIRKAPMQEVYRLALEHFEHRYRAGQPQMRDELPFWEGLLRCTEQAINDPNTRLGHRAQLGQLKARLSEIVDHVKDLPV